AELGSDHRSDRAARERNAASGRAADLKVPVQRNSRSSSKFEQARPKDRALAVMAMRVPTADIHTCKFGMEAISNYANEREIPARTNKPIFASTIRLAPGRFMRGEEDVVDDHDAVRHPHLVGMPPLRQIDGRELARLARIGHVHDR